MTTRNFTYRSRTTNSDKFWAIDLNGTSYTVRYGRSGSTGQSQTKSFDTAELAQAAHDKAIAGKLKKGYVEV